MTRSEEPAAPKADWSRVDSLTDAEIEQAVAEDPDAAPLLDEAWFREAEVVLPGAETLGEAKTKTG